MTVQIVVLGSHCNICVVHLYCVVMWSKFSCFHAVLLVKIGEIFYPAVSLFLLTNHVGITEFIVVYSSYTSYLGAK